MSGTTLIYNGIAMKNCLTLEFNQSVKTDRTDTDVELHVISIRVRSTLHASDETLQHGFEISGGGNAGATTAAMRTLQARLGQNRASLQYAVDDAVLLEVSPNNDLDSGPKVVDLKIVQIANFTFQIEFALKCSVVYCGNELAKDRKSNDFGEQVLSNRWSLSDTIDANNRTTRRWQGQARFKGMNPSPHSFRNFFVPRLLKGYKRIRQDFLVDANGLDFSYAIEDQRRHAAPPQPATDWRATHTEIAEVNGSINHAEINVWLRGPDDVNRRELIAAGVAVCEARLGSLAQSSVSSPNNASHSFLVEQARIVDHIDEPVVEVSYRIKRTAAAESFASFSNLHIGESLQSAEQPIPNYEPDEFPIIKPYDGALPANIFYMHLKDICNSSRSIATPKGTLDTFGNSQRKAEEKAPSFQQSTASLPEFTGFKFAPAHKQNVFTFYSGHSHYQTKSGKAVMPIATSSDQSGVAAKVIELHKPVTKRIIHIKAERVGKWPDLPRPESIELDAGQHVLLDYDVILDDPEISANGAAYTYRAEMRAEYFVEQDGIALRAGSPATDPKNTTAFAFNKSTAFVDPKTLI